MKRGRSGPTPVNRATRYSTALQERRRHSGSLPAKSVNRVLSGVLNGWVPTSSTAFCGYFRTRVGRKKGGGEFAVRPLETNFTRHLTKT
jgi:hypothetical protein